MSATTNIVPVNDLYPHVDHAGCPCGPDVEHPRGCNKLVVHNSWDGREAYESEIALPFVEWVAPGDVQ